MPVAAQKYNKMPDIILPQSLMYILDRPFPISFMIWRSNMTPASFLNKALRHC